jgi:TP901 family phage tail tape measure protein
MARAFNLTAEINLRGPSNIRTVVADIRRQLGSVDVNINPRINPASIRNITTMNTALRALNGTLSITSTNANSVSDALRNLGQSFNNVIGRNTQQGLNNASQNINNVGNNAGRAATQMQEFGRQSALAVRRFAAFTVVTSSIYAFTGALRQGISDFIAFDKEFVRLQQVTGESTKGLQGLADQITKLATSLGVSSSELTTVAVTLAQAGLSAADTRKALEALAKSSLAPSFDDMNQTVEGSIALMRQFGIGAGDLESALGSVNAVAAQFAVEASDLIVAIQRTGGVFATASRGVSEGTDALNEFLAIFTSVRATTRESAETIATGLRTIFTRIQRAETIQALEKFGVTLTDLEGKFVGPFEAVKRLSEGLSRLDPRDLQFSQIVEELGGFRQIGKVIPLIQQFAVAQQALKTAQTGQASLSKDAATAQLSIANQIAKVREEFTALVRSIGESDSFRSFISLSLQLASGLIKLADAAKIVLPALTALATIRGLSALTQFGAGFAGAFGAAGGARGLGQRLGGGRRFASGGLVPGSGNRDSVSAMLTPGEFVIRKAAVKSIGANRLHHMNKYAQGGIVVDPSRIGAFFLRPEEGPDRSPITIRGQGNIKNPLALKQLGIAPKTNDAKDQAFANADIKTQQKLLGLQTGKKKIDTSKIIKNGKVLNTQSAREALYNAGYSVDDVKNNFDPNRTQSKLKSGLRKGKLSVAGKAVPLSGSISGYYPGKNDLETSNVASTVAANARKALYNAVLKSVEPILSTLGNSVIGVNKSGATKGAKRIANDPNAQATTQGFVFEGLVQAITGAKLAGSQSNFDFPARSITAARESLKNMFTDNSGEGLSTLVKADAKRSNTPDAIDSIRNKIVNDINKGKFDGVNFVKGFANGGNVDTVPAMLTPGEFVINKKAAKKIGSSRLHSLNRADKISGFNKGGMVGGVQTFANGGGVQKFFAGGVVAGLTRLGPVLVKAFSSLSNTATKLGSKFTLLGRNVPSGGGWTGRGSNPLSSMFNIGRGSARGGSSSMGGMGGFVALTAGGVAIEGLSSLAGDESKSFGVRNKDLISNMGGDALNYATIGTTIGSFFGPAAPLAMAVGGTAGALIGLTTGFFKAQKATEEFAEQTRRLKIEKSSESVSALLDQFIKNPEANKENLDVGMADIFAELKSLAAQEGEKNLSKESLKTKTATEIVTTQKAGSESATRILEAAMGKTGKTLDEVSASIDPKTFRILTQQIAQVSPEYIAKWQELVNETDPERQKALNAELDDIRMKYSRVALAAKENEIIEKRRADEAAKIVKEIDKTLDIYRRANAYADKYAASLERLIKATDARTNDFSNAPKVQDVDRKNEEVLGNLSAFSFKEVRAAAGGVAGLAGGSPEAKALADQAVASKILADQLPALVKSTDITNRGSIVQNLKGLFQAQGINIETPEISKVLNDVGNRLRESASDTDVDKLTKELEGTVISELSKTAQEGSQLLQKLTKTYNDTLQESINLQNKYNEAMGRSNEYMRKAGVIRLNAELDLAKALGNSPTLRQLNEPFEFEIKDLTKGLRDVGGLRANQAMDPAAIGLAMMRTSQENARLEAENAANLEKASGLGADEAGNRQRADIAAANLNNVAALGKNKLALDEGRQALEKLANDGTKAANALAKIQEEQQKVEGFGNFLEKVFTSSFDELFQMNRESAAFAAAQAQGPEFMRNVENRQLAFAGLNAQKELYSPQEFANLRADLLEKSLAAQGFQGQDFVGKLGMTVEEALNRIRGRVSEEDPNVIAYREAVNEQIKANEILGLLNKQQALIIQESMLDLQIFLAKDFPNILIQALADARADAGAANPKNLPVAVPPGGAVPPAAAAPAAAAAAAPVGVLPAPPAPGAGGVLDRLNAERAQLQAQKQSVEDQMQTKIGEIQQPKNVDKITLPTDDPEVENRRKLAEEAINIRKVLDQYQKGGVNLYDIAGGQELMDKYGGTTEAHNRSIDISNELGVEREKDDGGIQRSPRVSDFEKFIVPPTQSANTNNTNRVVEGVAPQTTVGGRVIIERDVVVQANAQAGAANVKPITKAEDTPASRALASHEKEKEQVQKDLDFATGRAANEREFLAQANKEYEEARKEKEFYDSWKPGGIRELLRGPEGIEQKQKEADERLRVAEIRKRERESYSGAAEKTKSQAEHNQFEWERKHKQLQADKDKEINSTTIISNKPMVTSTSATKPKTPYEQMMASRRQQYQNDKLARRRAAASRYRPEVARRMFPDLYQTQNATGTALTQTPSGTPQVAPSTIVPPQAGNQVVPTTGEAAAARAARDPGTPLNPYANGDAQLSARMDSYSNPTHPFEQRLNANGPTATGGPTGGNGFQIQLDPNAQAFLDSLSSTFSTFNTYIDKLSAVAATIPPKIELTGNYVLDVQISGAAAFEALDKRMKELAVSLVEPKLAALRDEVSTATGGQVKSSATMGSPSSGATSSQGQ